MNSTDLSLLVTLDALLREQSVSGAAKKLGLSTPAVSHALTKIRERFGDPILVRVGRAMALTPRAEELRPRVGSLIEAATKLLELELPFSPQKISRTFTIYATDHILLVLGPVITKIIRETAPGVVLKFLPSACDDWKALREGNAELSICIPGHFKDEFLTRHLFTERFVCALSVNLTGIGDSLSMKTYLAHEHIVVSPLGYPSVVDTILNEAGHCRKILATVPFFLTGLHMLTHTDAILTVSERAALALKDVFNLKLYKPPIELPTYALNLLWHPRVDSDPEHRWLREQFLAAAQCTEPNHPLP